MIGTQDEAENMWIGDIDGAGAFHENFFNPHFAVFSNFMVENLGTPLTPDFPQDIIPDPNVVEWFTADGGNPVDCCDPPGIIDDTPDGLDDAIAADSVDSGTPYSETTNWLLKKGLFARLDATPSMVQNYPNMAAFYNSNLNTTVGQFHQVEQNIFGMANLPSTETGQYHSNFNTLYVKLEALMINDSLLQHANTATDSANLLAARQVILSDVENLENENDSLETVIQTHRIGLTQQYGAQNAAINASAVYETNEKTVNGIYLNTVALGTYTLTPQQVTDLQAIVWQCPKMGGNAVYRARSLYGLAVDTVFNDWLLCAPPQQMEQDNQNVGITTLADNQSVLFPNPATKDVTLNITNSPSANRLVIMDMSGKTVMSKYLSNKMSKFNFSVANIPVGIYIVELRNGQLKIHAEKLVISH